ncbi:MAG TPA: hypothetical protein VGH69_13965 [Mycobacterium sp.]|jgi:hypothetical protein
MAALRSLLALYGALDEAIIRSEDPQVAATVDAFMPMASANTGWYSEIETFFFGADARPVPNLNDALTEIVIDILGGNPLTTAQKSRLFFAVSAITRVRQVAGPSVFPSLPESASPPESDSSEPDDPFNNWLAYALAAVGPEHISDDERRFQALSFQDQVPYRLPNRQSFYAFRAFSAEQEWIVAETLKIPLCDTSVVKIDGIESVVIDTETSSDDVSLNQLKAVVNPYNWHKNYPDFFCDMIACRPPERGDGWRRVLEKVGFCKYGGLNLSTLLKYVTTEDPKKPYEARLDYDLDEPRGPEGDGQVTVDRGFINMWSTVNNANANGVRVRTRKVVHINGFLPYAQARLVCITGYASASNEFLFGPAADPPPGAEEFKFYDTGVHPATADETVHLTAAGTGTGPPPTNHVGTTAVKLWTETVRDLTTNYFNLAGKWMTGSLQVDDVADYGKQITSRLVKAPMDFVEAVSKPRYPGGPSGGDGQGGAYPDDPSGTLQQQEDMVRALLYQLNVIADEAAAEDKAGKWGLDGWIRVIHNLVDLQVRAYAAILQTSVAGSWWKKLFFGEPWPSEPVKVDPEPFARDLRAGAFRRAFLPRRTIPPSLIGFRPEYLPAGATQFQMYVKDYRYIGSNYTGDVFLTSRYTTPPVSTKITVTVGM